MDSERGLNDPADEVYRLAEEVEGIPDPDDLIAKAAILGAKMTAANMASTFGGIFSAEQMRDLLPGIARDVETNASTLGNGHPAVTALRRMLAIYREKSAEEV